MDFDILIKAATFVLGAIGAAKIFHEVSIGRRTRMREEYKFAKDFLDEVSTNEHLHPFLREKGYQSIAGDNQLNSEEIAYLLSLKAPDRALRDYVLGRPYLEHLPHVGDLQIAFRKKFEAAWSRLWRKGLYFALYAILVFLAFAPLLLSKLLFKGPTEMVLAFTGCLAVFGPWAWTSLKTASSIYRAEKLVQHQHKHTQRILISSSGISFQRTASGGGHSRHTRGENVQIQSTPMRKSEP